MQVVTDHYLLNTTIYVKPETHTLISLGNNDGTQSESENKNDNWTKEREQKQVVDWKKGAKGNTPLL